MIQEKLVTKSQVPSKLEQRLRAIIQPIWVVGLLLLLSNTPAHSQDTQQINSPEATDVSTVIGGYDVPESTFDPAVGVVIDENGNPLSAFGGVTKIGPNHGLTAAHVAEYLQEKDLYVIFNCRTLDTCTAPIQRKLRHAYLFGQASDWELPAAQDVAVVSWAEPLTTIVSVSLDNTTQTEEAGAQIIRGHGCQVLGGAISPAQKEGLVKKTATTPDQNESKLEPAYIDSGAACPGDSGSLVGVRKMDGQLKQTGIVVRTNGVNSYVERVRVYYETIMQCMRDMCGLIKLYPPGVATPTATRSPDTPTPEGQPTVP
jgi:hypothetical protein